MTAFDQFLQGEDALARLIRSQPAFEPTAEQEARLFAALTSLQPVSALSGDFEPPAAMEANFLQQTRAIAAAQAPRRDALLDRLRREESAEVVLGHAISTATQDWLASQTITSTIIATAPPPRMRWWQWGGMIVVPALVAGIGFQLFFPAQRGQTANLAIFQPASAPPAAVTTRLAESAPALPMLRAAKAPPNTKAKSLAAPEFPLQLADNIPAPAISQAAAPRMMALAPPAAESRFEQPVIQQESARLAADKLAMDSSKERAAPAPAAMAQPRPMSAEAIPSTAAAKPVLAKKSAALHPRIILLSDDPGLVAASLLPSTLGYIIRTAEPESPAVQNWLTRLREARRGHTALQIETDATLASGQLLIFPINPEEK